MYIVHRQYSSMLIAVIYTVLFTAYIEKPAHKIINNIMYKGTLEKNKKKTWRFLSPFGKIPAREKKN